MQIKSLQHQINDIKEVTKEIKTMNETLIVLTEELKHTNNTLKSYDDRLDTLEVMPKNRWNTLVNAVLTAIVSGFVGYAVAHFVGM
jgi:flagellar capping protein FliD